MKTTWTLELKGDRAQRAAQRLRRDLQSLQAALENVDGASSRLNATLGRFSSASGVQRRVAGERQVARAAARTVETQRVGHRRLSTDEATQRRVRVAAERAQASTRRAADRDARKAQRDADRAQRNADREKASSERGWRRHMRDVGRNTMHQWRLEQGQARDAERNRRSAVRDMREQNRTQAGLMRGTFGVLSTIASTAAAITATAAAMVGGFAMVGVEIGRWILQMAVFRESAVTTLGAVLGGRGTRGAGSIQQVGAAAYRRAQAVARQTPADEAAAIQASTQIAAAGYSGRQGERVNAASLDVQALQANDPTAQSRFVLGLSQLHGSARARDEDIRQTAGAAGLNRTAVTLRAARLAGINRNAGETDLAYQNRVDAARREGRITGAHAEEAILQELQGLTGQRLGGFAAERGNSLGGALSNLESAPLGMITSIGLENLSGLSAMRDSLFAIGNALNGSSEAGQALRRALAGILNAGGQTFATIFSRDNVELFTRELARILPLVVRFVSALAGPALEGFMEGIAPMLQSFRDGNTDMDSITATAMLFAQSLGYIVGLSVRLTVAFGEFFVVLTILGAGFAQFVEAITSIPARIGDLAIAIGTALVNGIRQGITAGIASARETVTGFAGGIVGAARDALGIRSPSRVFAELGAYSAEGFTVGLNRGAPDVSSAVSGMLSGGAGAAGGLGRGPVSITINIDGRGQSDDDLADTLVDRLSDFFAGRLDAAALTVG